MEDFAERLRKSLPDRYRIVREIGRGGMSVVYLARDLQHDRDVAIKALRSELALAGQMSRFLQEIQITARLIHPNILPLHDSGDAGGVLYYVMPYIQSGSLKNRMRRDTMLSLKDVFDFTGQIANALDYAHTAQSTLGEGVVHRDIKPENVLVTATGHVFVADFGIARILSRADEETLTSYGIIVGTWPYMSPEQCAGDKKVDHRTDVYALGCVVYELLGGEPPFTGPTGQAIASKHMSQMPASLRVVRPDLPGHVDAAVMKALAKVPGDRFHSAGDFAKALVRPMTATEPSDARAARTRTVAIGAAAAVALFIGLFSWDVKGSLGWTSGADTTRLALVPFFYAPGVDTSVNEVQRLYRGLAQLKGLTVVEQSGVRKQISSVPSRLTPAQAARIARRAGAGRYIWGEISPLGDSLGVRVALYDVRHAGTTLAHQAIVISKDRKGIDSIFADAGPRLLVRGPIPEGRSVMAGTQSLPARQALARGEEELEFWNLTRADLSFAKAAEIDPAYAEANLWVGLVRAWSGAEVARWQSFAEKARLRAADLSARDQAMLRALLAQSRAEAERSCDPWRRMTKQEALDFISWYGLASCLANDSTVVGSSGAWRFRSSYQAAFNAYRKAFQLHPAVLVSYRGTSFGSLRRLFKVSGNEIRSGAPTVSEPAGFVAFPSWERDSIAYTPLPRRLMGSLKLTSAGQEAVKRLRLQFRDVAIGWLSTDERNPAALEALAISLSILGDPSGLDTLRRAQALSTDSSERLRFAAEEVWMQLAFAIPDDTTRLADASRLARALLRNASVSSNSAATAWLAALTGHPQLAANSARPARSASQVDDPADLGMIASPLLIYAALGGPIDTIAGLERRLNYVIDHSLPVGERVSKRRKWLERSATLAFSVYRFEALPLLGHHPGPGEIHPNPLLAAQIAWASNDTMGARRQLQTIRDSRVEALPWNLTVDGLCPEAELLFAMGDFNGAAARLFPTLDVVPQIAPQTLADPVRVASLVRAMVLRARIAHVLGDQKEARRWAKAVTVLWADADEPFLRRIVSELLQLAI